MKKYMRQWLLILTLTLTCAGLSGCASSKEKKNELDGTITGNTYQAAFYSNDGDKFMAMSGQKINLKSNIVMNTRIHRMAGVTSGHCPAL